MKFIHRELKEKFEKLFCGIKGDFDYSKNDNYNKYIKICEINNELKRRKELLKKEKK